MASTLDAHGVSRGACTLSTAVGSSPGIGAEGLVALERLHRDQRDRERYDIGEEAGRGGLGRVWRATDRELGRPVAVKELLRRDPVSEARFFREAMLTARLDHPGIITVHETGRWDDGTPFYTMKLVDGQPLSALIRKARAFADRLALLPQVTAVADAIAYAHAQGVVHRDLKPANVIVGRFGETLVIDFGLAALGGGAAVPGEGDCDGALTACGAVIGTPAFMAPEQARGEPADERTDIYALGAILYTVLAGTQPYPASSSIDVLDALRAGPPRPVDHDERRVPPALAAIVARAMARAPGDRYPSVSALALDLKRFQTGQLVGAHSYSPVSIARWWLTRHRTAVAVAGVAAIVLAAGAAYAVARIVDERDVALGERARAHHERDTARARADQLLLSDARQRLETDPTAALAALATYPRDGADWAQVAELTSGALDRGAARQVLATVDETSSKVAYSTDGRYLAAAGVHSLRVWRVADAAVVVDARYADGLATSSGLAVAHDAPVFAAAQFDGRIRVADARTGAAHERVVSGTVNAIDLDAGGGVVFSAHGDGTLRRWDVASGVERRVAAHQIYALDLQRIGSRLLSVGPDRVALWSLDLVEERSVSASGAVLTAAALAPDGARIAAGDEQGNLWLWDGRARRRLAGGDRVENLVFSRDGTQVYAACVGDVVRVWDLATGTSVVHPGGWPLVRGDGDWLAAGASDGTIAVVAPRSGWVRRLRGHRREVRGVAWSPEGELASVADGVVRIWPRELRPRILDVGAETVRNARITGDGRWLVAASDTGAARAWELATDRVMELHGHRGGDFVRTDQRGAWLVGLRTGEVTAWDPQRGEVAVATVTGQIYQVEVASEDELLVGTGDGRVIALDHSGAATLVVGLDGEIRRIVRSADGLYLGIASSRGDIAIYDPRHRQVVARARQEGGVAGLGLLDRERWIVLDHGVVRWVSDGDLAHGRNVRVGLGNRVVSGSGGAFAVLAPDGWVRAWSWDGSLRAELRHIVSSRGIDATLTAGPRRLVTAGYDGVIQLADLDTGARRNLPAAWPLWDVTAGGDALVVAGPKRYLQVWSLSAMRWSPRAAPALAAWLQQIRASVALAFPEHLDGKTPDALAAINHP